jgi:Tfp pilus assembly protein PilN
MRAVNLLPRQTASRKLGFDPVLAVAAAVTILVAAAVAGGFFLEKAHAGTARQQAAAAQAALARAQSQQSSTHPSAQLTIPVVLSQEQPWHVALDTALSTRVSWDTLLAQLEYVVPDTVTLTTVTLGSSSGTTSGSITLGGTAYTSGDVAQFLAALARVPKLSQVALTSSAVETGKNDVTFQITASMTLPVAAVAPTPADATTTGGQG